MAQNIVPNIWCNRTAEEAGEFYARVFGAAGIPATTEVLARYPDSGLPEFQREFAGEALLVSVSLRGTELALVNAGPEFRPNPALSFMLNFDPLFFGGGPGEAATLAARHAIDAVWEALAATGTVRMPLGEYPFSAHYGWIEDEFGVNWQLMLTRPEGAPRPFVVPALMFDGPAQNRAAKAADHYAEVFAGIPGGTEIGTRFSYGVPTGSASADALAFGEFRLGDTWFMGSDNGSGTDHGFTPGVSLQVNCADQTEIDHLWAGLSAVPEAERCGWLTDRFGVSWQIVPANMGELMARPGAYERLMGMGRIVIAEL